MSGEILSRLKHAGLILDGRGGEHLIVAEGEGSRAVIELLERGLALFASRTYVLYCPSITNCESPADRLAESHVRFHFAASLPELLTCLRNALEAALVGLRLYVAGSESFIAEVVLIAQERGVSYDSIQTDRRGSLARRVQCVHCKRISGLVSTNYFRCSKCGLLLFVRDHYSRRIGSYMGVAANAEDAAEPLTIAEIYP